MTIFNADLLVIRTMGTGRSRREALIGVGRVLWCWRGSEPGIRGPFVVASVLAGCRQYDKKLKARDGNGNGNGNGDHLPLEPFRLQLVGALEHLQHPSGM